ncbi:serine hydrolase [Aliifodinibius sp. S!AR15-10]|uniref:glycoside hydrolase family 3 N-terminal domain-containing protein n=1 Tax=Aliifodinibius sp. S!AR15-10 TaxID=2950437 RepID=UPI00286164D7|nr:glycoside hydrolase family 3 N-terminal domain-containing protein [Aliifodinibius sp. S!AR15-10]MDR8390509.1 serine hydrolase [Aliifodinibius sp. S!AR15-10]
MKIDTPRFCNLCFFALLIVLSACSSSRETASSPGTEQQETMEQESVLSQPETVKDSTAENGKPVPPSALVLSGETTVEGVLNQMSLREKIGQLFVTYANGYFFNEDSEAFQDLEEKVQKYHVGGIIFSSGNVYGQAVLHNKLQAMSKLPLWVTQDMEFGAAMRVSRTTYLSPAMGIAATQNPEYAYWAGKITAREAKALGVHQIFAPVLDVNNNPDNPVINVRSFSGDPKTVSTFGNAFINGVQSEGVVSTAKHFPGHGDTDVDSHLSLPVINHGYMRLDTLELVPFKAAIDGGIASIMSAHIAFPKISSNGTPGTLNEQILNRILLDSLNFNGLVVTDGLEMRGISSRYSPGETVVKALKAGADLMLLSPDEITAINEIVQAVHMGNISEERIDRSVRKLLAWKKQHGLFEDRMVDLDQLDKKINTRQHQLIADEIARKSLTVVKNEGDILPIRPYKYPEVMVLSIADDISGDTGSYFARQLKEYHPNVTFHVYDRRTSEEEKREIRQDAREADLIIFGSFIYVRSAQPMQLSSEQFDFLKELANGTKPSLLVAFGNPYIVRDLSATDAQVMAWSARSDQVRNTVPALFGASHINGRMPINIPGHYKIGDGIEIPQTTIRKDEPGTVGLSHNALRKVDDIMRQAVFDSTFPGGTVTVLKNGVIAHQKSYGYHTYDKLKPVEPTDIYDLASLTKVVATTTAIMRLVDEGKVELDDKVSKYIPEFRQVDKSEITIHNLLSHNSGLPPFRVYVDSLKDREKLIQAVKEEPLIYETGTEYQYSDLGFILLAEIVEQVSGSRIDQYIRKEMFYTMGMNSTFFNPSLKGQWISSRIPPTEVDTVFRKDTVHTVVHDERAFYMNGIAGHAGLFSNGTDLAVYAQMLLNGGTYGGRRYLSEDVIQKFTTRQSNTSNRGLGFDRKSPDFSTAGTLTSDRTFGHTGFTGTSIWIDPERNLSIIILTNRVHPYRSYGHNISKIRAAVADAVVSSIIEEQQ